MELVNNSFLFLKWILSNAGERNPRTKCFRQDVENSRSDMDVLEAFRDFDYRNEIGPGVYDIHSPRVPTVEEMVALLERAARVIPVERLWVNPDCGLKTRGWPEVFAALSNMVEAARRLRMQVRQSGAEYRVAAMPD